MLFNQDPNLLIKTNEIGEYWLEFICLNVMLLVIIIAFKKEIKRLK